MRVLAITNEFPLPPDRGGPVRFLGLARALARDHDVHLLALERPNTTPALVEELREVLGGPVETFTRDEATGARLTRWVGAVRSGVPPWVQAQHSAKLAGRAAQLARDSGAVAILDDYAGVYAGATAPFAPVVCDKSNIMGWTAAETGAGPRRRLHMSLIRRFEAAYLKHASGVVVTSPEEAERLQALYGAAASAVVPSAVDLPLTASEPAGERAVGWLGSLEYAPNVEGLVRFAEEAWAPLGHEGLRLRVAGSPAEAVRGLERLPGVELLDFVADLAEFMSGLDAAVVPLWHGAGVKLKTLSFMAAGVAVAATPVALEGIDGYDGGQYAMADDPADLATAIRNLVDDPETARRIGRAGRELVAERYVWDRVGPRFVDAVERAASARS